MVFQIIDAPDVFSFSYQGLEVLAGAIGFSACQLPARGINSIQVILHTSKLEHKKEARTWYVSSTAIIAKILWKFLSL